MDLPKIQIIVGSTRPGRIGLQIANWLKDELDYIDEAKVETIDLAAINLPFLDELAHPATGQYSNDHTLAWSRKIKEGNGYIWLTPEYNAGYSAPIKNAIDYLYQEWADKPVLVASYGAGGGPTANHNLVDVVKRVKAQAVEPTIELTIKPEMRAENGQLKDPFVDFKIYQQDVEISLKALIDMINKVCLADQRALVAL